MTRGRFVVLEGGDTSGKSTQARRLVLRLRAAGRRVVETFEPGDTAAGQAIRDLLLEGSERIDPRTEALLLAADRAQQVSEIVAPALARGEDVVSDRYIPSSLAYQGLGRGLGLESVRTFNDWATEGLNPDLVIVLDVSDAVAESRRFGPRDRLEREGPEFHHKVRQGYRELASEYGWHVLDGARSEQQVADEIWVLVSELCGLAS
jgi:dTMP kinase